MPKRFNVDVLIAAKLYDELDTPEIPIHDMLRRGLAVMKAFSSAKRRGFNHLGFTSDAGRLDIEVINVL